MRLDQYLDKTCLMKTRSAAAKAIRAGEVRIGGHPAKASHTVRPGETIEIVSGGRRLIVEVTGIPPESVSKQEAHSFYRVQREHRAETE